MHTNRDPNPWWCADMGANYHVKRVVLRNRQDSCQERAQNLRIGVTNTRPVVEQDLALNAYSLVGEKPGQMNQVEVVGCSDEVSGRYLVVQFNITEYMNIAQIKIYGYENRV